jgi:hypothetical protein
MKLKRLYLHNSTPKATNKQSFKMFTIRIESLSVKTVGSINKQLSFLGDVGKFTLDSTGCKLGTLSAIVEFNSLKEGAITDSIIGTLVRGGKFVWNLPEESWTLTKEKVRDDIELQSTFDDIKNHLSYIEKRISSVEKSINSLLDTMAPKKGSLHDFEDDLELSSLREITQGAVEDCEEEELINMKCGYCGVFSMIPEYTILCKVECEHCNGPFYVPHIIKKPQPLVGTFVEIRHLDYHEITDTIKKCFDENGCVCELTENGCWQAVYMGHETYSLMRVTLYYSLSKKTGNIQYTVEIKRQAGCCKMFSDIRRLLVNDLTLPDEDAEDYEMRVLQNFRTKTKGGPDSDSDEDERCMETESGIKFYPGSD